VRIRVSRQSWRNTAPANVRLWPKADIQLTVEGILGEKLLSQLREIAAICTDTWGCEVRPNETAEAQQPWYWVVIPMIGFTMGEIFVVDHLADDCVKDGIYEFFFCAPPLPITGGCGSPLNPIAIK
jgi:hypothetical protein